MKFLFKYYLLLLSVFAPYFACNTSELAALNDHPDDLYEINWNYLFTDGILLAAENRQSQNVQLFYCSAMIQHLADLEVTLGLGNGDKYFKKEEWTGTYYSNCYVGITKKFDEAIRQTGPAGNDPQMVNLHHATRVMRVFVYHRCADLYGDIPYSEANKAYDEGIFFPVFDRQKDIYLDMLKELSEAAEGFDKNQTDKIFNSQDIIYDGDVDKWKKFAYSLMLRLAMRISLVDASTAQVYVTEAINGGVFTGNADNARVPRASGPNTFINSNGISMWLNPDFGATKAKLSDTFIDFLRDNNDPRLMIITSGIGQFGSSDKIVDPALQKGMPNGFDASSIREYEGVMEDVDVETTYSKVNELLLDLDDPNLFQTYAEVEFLLAEAAVRGWHSADPADHYNKGVRAAMQMYDIFDPSLTVSDAEVDAYLAAHPYDTDKGLEMIGTQYWVATFLNFYETYANWRRTGFPVLEPVNYPGNHTNGTIPRRMIFEKAAVSRNEANYQAAINRMGGDELTTKVWWDGGN